MVWVPPPAPGTGPRAHCVVCHSLLGAGVVVLVIHEVNLLGLAVWLNVRPRMAVRVFRQSPIHAPLSVTKQHLEL